MLSMSPHCLKTTHPLTLKTCQGSCMSKNERRSHCMILALKQIKYPHLNMKSVTHPALPSCLKMTSANKNKILHRFPHSRFTNLSLPLSTVIIPQHHNQCPKRNGTSAALSTFLRRHLKRCTYLHNDLSHFTIF